jgi:xanthine dehydrogenase accessory factor
MTDLLKILSAYQQHPPDRPLAIATLVKTQGSSYRRPGARMLISSTGIVGGISGGCLEQDVIDHAQTVMQSGEPRLLTYDSTAQEDIVWGLGLGCNGIVQIWVERVDIHSKNAALPLLSQGLRTQQASALVTVFESVGDGSIPPGSTLLVTSEGITGKFPDCPWKQTVIADAHAALACQRSQTVRYQSDTGDAIEVLIEIVQPPVNLWIFGAGHDAVPVAQFAKALGWQVTLVDCRSLAATAQRFPMVDRVILTRREQVEAQVELEAGAIAVVMTHHYLDDLEILKHLLASSSSYIGLLGSQRRTERLLDDLRQQGFTPASLENLYAPIGLDIGAETPEAIALAILTEIQAVCAQRQGGFLRDRQAAIHTPISHHERMLHPDQIMGLPLPISR